MLPRTSAMRYRFCGRAISDTTGKSNGELDTPSARRIWEPQELEGHTSHACSTGVSREGCPKVFKFILSCSVVERFRIQLGNRMGSLILHQQEAMISINLRLSKKFDFPVVSEIARPQNLYLIADVLGNILPLPVHILT
jgi:hypothetical protein